MFLNGLQKYNVWIFLFIIVILSTFFVIETRKSWLIRKKFNFRRDIMRINKKQTLPKVQSKEYSTLIGYSHKKPIYIDDKCKHCFVCGTTGSGKTVALSNFIKHGTDKLYPMLIVDGKGDMGKSSLLDIVSNHLKGQSVYIINLSEPEKSDKYNPFRNASATMCKDMLINMTDWSEEHYKLNAERYLQRLITLMQQSKILLSFKTITEYMREEKFQSLSIELLKSKIISKEEHLLNLEVAKTSGKIFQNASARFSTIAEGEIGKIFQDDGIDIYTALKQNAVILFILNPLLYPETSQLMGRLILIDSKQAVSRFFNQNTKRIFYMFDEISSYASPSLIDIVNKSRSANITCILATQSLSDLDYSVNEACKEQIIENVNNYLIMRQNSAVNAEHWANIIGTRAAIDVTYQLKENGYFSTSDTGLGSARRVREYLYHPDEIKTLSTGSAIYISKDSNYHTKIKVSMPF